MAFTHAVHDQRLLGDVSEAIGRVLRECTALQALRFGGGWLYLLRNAVVCTSERPQR